MKEIKAFVRPHKLDAVTMALSGAGGVSGMSVSDCKGFGHQKQKDGLRRPEDELVDFYPHVRMEILCRDDSAERLVSIIRQSAHTGALGDGIIYVSGVEQAVRISTGESGEEAL